MASYDRSRVRTPNEIRKEIDQDYIYHDVVFQKAQSKLEEERSDRINSLRKELEKNLGK